VLKAMAIFGLLVCSLAAQTETKSAEKDPRASVLQKAVRSGMAGKAGAAVVLDVESGKIMAQHGMDTAARRVATPGSTVKPFVLMALLDSQRLSIDEPFFCHRKLRIAGRRMDCTHPEVAAPFRAEEALAYSCNSYFAAMAERITDSELVSTLQRMGFTSPTGWSKEEATGAVTQSQTVEQRQLLALGERGIQITSLELLAAYRSLALGQRRGNQSWDVIYRGLKDSTGYGMAHAAAPEGYDVAGKTGTANSTTSASTHGWFAGYAPAEQPEIALVVYLEHGHGSDAAAVARTIFTAYAALKGAH
jgi:cell division protein FtsI/penicillin-binding protein 2